jgi:hypothetical protein
MTKAIEVKNLIKTYGAGELHLGLRVDAFISGE